MAEFEVFNLTKMMPSGTYSVGYKTRWLDPDVGNNAFRHEIVTMSDRFSVAGLKEWLKQYETSRFGKRVESECYHVQLTAVSKLD